jgi:hypothetical protein
MSKINNEGFKPVPEELYDRYGSNRRVYYIDVADMPAWKAEKFVEEIKRRLQCRKRKYHSREY